MRLCVIFFLGLILSASAAMAQETALFAARVQSEGAQTRVVFELREEREPSIFTLAAEAGRPHRVVIDLPEVDWTVPGGPTMAGQGLVTQIRYGRNRPGWSRIVLDLPAPVRIINSQTVPAAAGEPARIVLDLEAVDVESFVASSGFPSNPDPEPEPANANPAFNDIEAVLASLDQGTPQEEASTSEGTRARPVIVIDAGHGGHDPGAITVNGTQEKTIALEIARAVRDELQRSNLFDVYMTRDEDIYLRLNDRYAVAQDLDADFFISIHVDSNSSHEARGATIYTLSETASDDEAARVAERENQADRVAGYEVDEELTRILIDLAQRETMNLSAEMAAILVGSFETAQVNTVSRPHRFAGFRVLTAPDIPSILLETGFASNQRDADMLETAAYRQRMGRAITQALIAYFDLDPASGEGYAQNAAPNQ